MEHTRRVCGDKNIGRVNNRSESLLSLVVHPRNNNTTSGRLFDHHARRGARGCIALSVFHRPEDYYFAVGRGCNLLYYSHIHNVHRRFFFFPHQSHINENSKGTQRELNISRFL